MMWPIRRKSKRSRRHVNTPVHVALPWRRIMNGTSVVAVVVILCVLWYVADRGLHTYVAQGWAGRTATAQVVLTDAPPWMGESIREQIRKEAATVSSVNPLDQASLESVARVLLGNAWVGAVRQVRRDGNHRLIIDAAYRKPEAVVEGRDGYHLVDAYGVRLPGLYLRHTATRLGVPLVIGTAALPGPVGSVWPGDDLAAGLALVVTLAREPYMNQIRAVDVSRRDPMSRIHLVLHTDRGQIRWGLPPGREHPIEPTVEVKKQILAHLAGAHHGAIDAGGRIVDIYDGNILVHSQMTGSTAIQTGYTESQ